MLRSQRAAGWCSGRSSDMWGNIAWGLRSILMRSCTDTHTWRYWKSAIFSQRENVLGEKPDFFGRNCRFRSSWVALATAYYHHHPLNPIQTILVGCLPVDPRPNCILEISLCILKGFQVCFSHWMKMLNDGRNGWHENDRRSRSFHSNDDPSMVEKVSFVTVGLVWLVLLAAASQTKERPKRIPHKCSLSSPPPAILLMKKKWWRLSIPSI